MEKNTTTTSDERVQQWLALAKSDPNVAAAFDLLAKTVIENHRAKQAAAEQG